MLWDAQTSSFPLHVDDGGPSSAGWEGWGRSRAHGEPVAVGRAGGGEHRLGHGVVSIDAGHHCGASQRRRGTLGTFGCWSERTNPAAHPCVHSTIPLQGLISHPWPLSLSTAEVLASQTPYRQPDLRGQDWAGETPASSRSPPATSPPPGWGCWAPVGCWAPPSAAPPPAPPSSSKADRLVGVHGISSFSIPSPQASFAFSSLTCPDLPFSPPPFSSKPERFAGVWIARSSVQWDAEEGPAGGGQTERRRGER